MTIDNRIVGLGFNNGEFERGTQQSLKSLEAMKKGLDFTDSIRNIGALSSAGKGFSLSVMGDALQGIAGRFTAMGVVGLTVIQNLTNAAINFGRRILTNMLTPMKSGFSEYETQMNSVQTVLANTRKEGTTLADVTRVLDDLNEYADRTIYSFSEMTKNIGTFTAAGVKLDTSAQAIKGIANLAAVSGSNSQQAATAMYQLSQALSSGTVKLMDWNSVVNAGMGGQVFQDALKETARVSGINIDALITKYGSFRETLQTGWLSSKVLLDTLQKFTGDLSEEQLKSLGYTEEQIKGILELGKTANDAATKVKTLTQLQETLKEAVGSGWAKTWQLIVGDFEKAKSLFTWISDILTGIVGRSADARNEALTVWQTLRGREMIINSLGKAFETLVDLVDVVKGAWKDFFPGKPLWLILIQITRAVTGFADAFADALSSGIMQNGEKFKRIFSGIFAVLRMGADIVRIVGQAIYDFLTTNINIDGNKIFETLARIGDGLVNFQKSIDLQATFEWVLSQIAKYLSIIKTEIDKLAPTLQKGIYYIGVGIFLIKRELVRVKDEILLLVRDSYAQFLRLKENLVSIFSQINLKPVRDFIGGLALEFKPFETIIKILRTVFVDGLKKINDIIPSLFKAGVGLYKIATWVGEVITKALQGINFAELFETLNTALIGGILLSIKKFVKTGKGQVAEIGGIFGALLTSAKTFVNTGTATLSGISGILDGVRTSFEAWQNNLKSKTLLNIAISIGILAASLIALSFVDAKKLVDVLGIVTGMFVQLIAAQAAYNKVGAAGIGSSAAIVALSVALLILSGAISILAKLDKEDMTNAIGTIYALMAGMLAFSKTIGKSGGLVGAGVGMTAIAISMFILAEVIKKLAKMDPDALAKGLLSVGVLLAEIAVFLRLVDGKSIGKMAGLIGVAAAIGVLSFAVEKFGKMNIDMLQQGLIAIAAILAEIAIFTQMSGNGTNLIATSIGVVILGAALMILTKAIEQLGGMNTDTLVVGLAALAAILGIITAAMHLLPKGMIFKAVGLAIVAGAMLLISDAFKTLSGLSWEEVGRGLTAMAGALAILVVALYSMSGTLLGSAALLVATAALMLLVPTLKSLGSIPMSELLISLAALAGIFVILGVAGAVLTPVVPTLLALGGAMLLIGAGAALVGIGLMTFGAGLMTIAAGGATAALGIMAFITTILGIVPVIINALLNGIKMFALGIAETAPAIFLAFTALLGGLLQLIIDIAPKLFEALSEILKGLIQLIADNGPPLIAVVIDLLVSLLQTIAERLPEFLQAGFDIIIAFLEGIRDNIPEVIATAVETIVAFLTAVVGEIPKIIQAGVDLIVAFIDGLTEGLENNRGRILEAIRGLATSIITGLVDGLAGGAQSVIDAIIQLAKDAIAAAWGAFESNSPSKVMIRLARTLPEGIVYGLKKYGPMATNGMENLVDDMIDSAKNVGTPLSNLMDIDDEHLPTITPVVDLQNVYVANDLISSMFGDIGIRLRPMISKSAEISSSLSDRKNVQEEQVQNGSQTAVEINQYNYSPKALSEVELYRLTKNLVGRLGKAGVG